ncbi:MAG: serine/threonine protein kinase [Verrucomicrobiaceae bacterium]|nr:serine/threonine protein kinase [Verrucomicrobiaceae bacterium]
MLPIAVSVTVTVAYVVSTFLFMQGLPAHLATHFDATGRPNGWMTKAETIRFDLLMGLGMQALLILLFSIMRFIPARFVNMPHKDYWQKPENFRTACTYLARYALWLGSLMLLWMILLNYQVAEANRALLPHLDPSGFVVAMGTFAAMLVLWVICVWRQFRVPTEATKAR